MAEIDDTNLPDQETIKQFIDADVYSCIEEQHAYIIDQWGDNPLVCWANLSELHCEELNELQFMLETATNSREITDAINYHLG